LQVSNSFGSVELRGVTGGLLRLELNSSDFTGSDISAQSLYHSNRFGDNRFQAVSAEKFSSDCNSGKLDLDGCMFGDMLITSRFGDITAVGITSAGADIDVNSGDIKISGEFSGATVIRANFGGVKLSTSREKADYSYDISARFGNIKFDGDRVGGSDSSINGSSAAGHSLRITVSSGDVEVNFASR
jgi:hypothetical protein